MPKTYSTATPETYALMRHSASKWHSQLVAEKVRIGIVMVHPPTNEKGEVVGPGLTHGSVPVKAKIRLVSGKDRTLMPFDAVIDVDAESFDNMSEPESVALFDHELEHIVIRTGRAGQVLSDDYGNTKLQIVPDDWTLTGFKSIIDRHGKDAVEAQAIFRVNQLLADEHGQILFPFTEPAAACC